MNTTRAAMAMAQNTDPSKRRQLQLAYVTALRDDARSLTAFIVEKARKKSLTRPYS